MRICFRCQFENEDEAVLCKRCGVHLDNADLSETLPTIDIIQKRPEPKPSQYNESSLEVGTIMLEIEGAAVIKPIASKITIGRRSDLVKTEFLIDLTPFGALEHGVSRVHAEMQMVAQMNLMLRDLGSANGTFINRVELTPHEAYRLHNGDLVQFGNLVTYVYFKAPGESGELPVPKQDDDDDED